MTGKELNYIKETVNNEGFEYTFVNYSDFEDIQDKEFQLLRMLYLNSRAAFREYLGLND